MPPGPKPLPRERVYHATWAILEELTTIDGMPFDDWLMKLTPEEVEALQRPPTRKRTLSLDTWKRTTEGWAVFKREGQEKYEAWATDQTKKLSKYKKIQMQELLDHVGQRLGRKKKLDHPPKGTFLKFVPCGLCSRVAVGRTWRGRPGNRAAVYGEGAGGISSQVRHQRIRNRSFASWDDRPVFEPFAPNIEKD